MLKLMKPEDRVLFVGTSRSPYECEMKGLTGAFQKVILIPRPDYASRYCEYSYSSESLESGTRLQFSETTCISFTLICSS